MYFLRWIAGYPILIILLVVGLYALYNKDNFSHWFEKNEAGVQTTELGHVEEQVASAAEKSSPVVETQVEAEAEGKPGSWLDVFKGRKTETEAASLPAQEEQTIVATSSAGVEIAKSEEGRSGEQMMEGIPSMSEMGEMPFMPEMNDIPPMPEMGEMPAMPEFGDIPPMPEMKEFPPMEPFPEMQMEPAFVPPMDESVAMAPTTDENLEKATSDTEEAIVEAEGKSGSWLDIFKNNKTEPEEASAPAQAEQPVATTEVEPSADIETANVEKEEKSGSWLDIFKRKKEESSTENSADASGEFQLQQNESLRLAREAFWQRDFDAAEAIYTNMTKAEPDNARLLGEYGNVLLEAGKTGQALDVYEQVAGLLIAEGRTFELRPLLYFIGDQDPERAQKLTQKIQAQQETNK